MKAPNLIQFTEHIKYLINLRKLKNSKEINGDIDFFFIISAGRSGSTVLRKQLMKETNVHLPPESEDMIPKMAEILLNNKSEHFENKVDLVINFLSNQSYIKFWSIDLNRLKKELLLIPKSNQKIDSIIYEIYKQHYLSSSNNSNNTKLLIGDKSPFLNYYLEHINILFPKCKVIYLIRDPRSVVASYIEERNYSFEKALNRWKSSIYTYRKYKKIFDSRIMEISYERFVKDPEKIMNQLVDFLGAAKNDVINEPSEKILGDISLSHHRNVNNPINADSLHKWKLVLTDKQVSIIEKMAPKHLLNND
jgi:hypothetical protein